MFARAGYGGATSFDPSHDGACRYGSRDKMNIGSRNDTWPFGSKLAEGVLEWRGRAM